MKKNRVILTGVIGNALEFYDFTLYGVFAVMIAQLYFPSATPLVAILASWGALPLAFS
jgi:MFS transporter, MHS family, proline/betaine transporter